TKILMAMSQFLIDHRVSLPIATAAAAVGAFFYVRTDSGKRVLHFLQLHVPLLGPMFRKLHLARSLRMIGTMAGAGVPLTECVTTANDLCGNVYFRELWTD